MLVIVDYGIGNSSSIRNMLKRIGVRAEISDDISVIERAEKLILPGVGAFDSAIQAINDKGLCGVLQRKAINDKIPVLGVCLGMQILGLGSEEGRLPGLGWINMRAKRFPSMPGIKIPHMGWNTVTATGNGDLVTEEADARYYFVHSYYVKAENRENAVMTARHGIEFDAVVQSENIYGAQFHPEKSHRFGMSLLESFVRL